MTTGTGRPPTVIVGAPSRRRSCIWINRRRSNLWLTVLAFVIVIFQFWIVFYHATTKQSQQQKQDYQNYWPSNLLQKQRPFEIVPVAPNNRMDKNNNNNKNNHNHNNHNNHHQPHAHTHPRPPRLLIGIISNANNHMGLVYRNRHRQLFQLWNDSRLCLWKEFDPAKGCLVAYTFVLGGHNSTSTMPPFHLGAGATTPGKGSVDDDDGGDNNNNNNNNNNISRRPLTLKSIPSMPRFKDVASDDVTILNIRENMNDGKTPTFFHWASRVARRLDIDYIMKCDSDAFLRWNALWRFLHKELPWPRPIISNSSSSSSLPSSSSMDLKERRVLVQVPSTLLGAFRHKAYWKVSTRDESVWQREWYAGMHLYLAGQLYILSVDVAETMVREAKKWYLALPQQQTGVTAINPAHNVNTTFAAPYFAGHEDHDATSMIQQDPYLIYRWVSIPKHTTFWEHPVKGDYRWERILAREQRQQIERLEGKRPAYPSFTADESSHISPWNASRPSVVAIFLKGFSSHEETAQEKEEYLKEWKTRNDIVSVKGKTEICPISKYLMLNSRSSRNRSRTDNRSNDSNKNNNNGDYDDYREAHCDLFYVFVVGVRREGPTEVLSDVDSLRAQSPPFQTAVVDDTWYFNVHHPNNHQGIGTTFLYYLHEKLPNYAERLELIVLIQFDHWVQLTKFQQVVHAQASGHALVVGEMRDKYQKPLDFPNQRQRESFWYDEFDNIHLYLGSDCLAFGSSLVAGIVEQAQTNAPARRQYWENHLGHDLTVLAYFVPKVILHWVPITKSMRFWGP